MMHLFDLLLSFGQTILQTVGLTLSDSTEYLYPYSEDPNLADEITWQEYYIPTYNTLAMIYPPSTIPQFYCAQTITTAFFFDF